MFQLKFTNSLAFLTKICLIFLFGSGIIDTLALRLCFAKKKRKRTRPVLKRCSFEWKEDRISGFGDKPDKVKPEKDV